LRQLSPHRQLPKQWQERSLIEHGVQHQLTVALDCDPFDARLFRAPRVCEQEHQETAPYCVRVFLLDHDRVPYVVRELLAPTSQHQYVRDREQLAALQEEVQQMAQQPLGDFDT
jgi:hypothetical protein